MGLSLVLADDQACGVLGLVWFVFSQTMVLEIFFISRTNVCLELSILNIETRTEGR